MRHALRLLSSLALAGTVTLAVGCSGAPPPAPTENIGSSSQAITTSSILSRADEWVQAQLLYCQSPNGADDSIDPSCPSTCVRESNPSWDPYRSDCSGFVSWAWGLPAPGNTTDELAPADTSVSYVINGSDLQPGDALNIPGDHIVLFVSWQTVGTEANFYEEPGCSATPNYAHAFTSQVTIDGSNVMIAYEGATFTAIRYTGVTAGGDGGVVVALDSGTDTGASDDDSGIATPCVVTPTGASGECLDTSACAAQGGTSTADYCPGAANIQCCTGMHPTTSTDAGMAAPNVDSGSITPGSGTGMGTPGETTCAAAGGQCVSVASGVCDGHVGIQSCGAGIPSGCCLPGPAAPGEPTIDSGISMLIGPDGGRVHPTDASTNGDTLELGGSSGCSVAPSRSGLGDGDWLFGLGAIGFVVRPLRRRRPR